jgi:hypothetical protein
MGTNNSACVAHPDQFIDIDSARLGFDRRTVGDNQ